MRTKRNGLAIAIMCIMASSVIAQDNRIDEYLANFQSADWAMVMKAKENLENTEGKCIQALINLLKDNSVKKLVNTGDLIYPGAERFFGHGQIIDYDIDRIGMRAGWLLEELTFQNFGFSGAHIEPSKLMEFIRFNFPRYYNNSANRMALDNAGDNEKRDVIRKLSIQEAEKWWGAEAGKWSRYDALISALKSEDEKRQAKALFYLRNGKTKCTGLTKNTYKSKIEPAVTELAKSNLKRISEQAKLILVDTQYDWLAIKPSK